MATPTDARDAPCTPAALSFGALRGFSDLFGAYVGDGARLRSFFAHDFHAPGALKEVARQAAAHSRDRRAIAETLRVQNERWGADEKVRLHLDWLERKDTAALVTGQQLGLFGGPLYTLYKTITAIQLAAELTASGQPTVPVFWLHGEDHDLAEIDHFTVLDSDTPVTLRYKHPATAGENAGPVGRLVLTEDITRVLGELEALLPVTADRDRVMAVLRDAYAPGTTMTDAFARFLRALFPDAGLVFLNPDDPDLKKHLVSLFQHDVRHSAEVSEEIARTSAALVENGFHAQVHVAPTNLFYLSENGRLAIDQEAETYRVRGTERVWAQAALLDEIAATPERFSPNVLLRPLAQDTLVPTAAYVAGPGEIAYYAQFCPAYESAGVPMPVIYPRLSATIVGHHARKLLERHDLSILDIDAPLDQAFQRAAESRLDTDAAEALAYFEGMLFTAVEGVKPSLVELDVNLRRSVEATRTRLQKEVARLRTRAIRAEKRRRQDLRQAIERIQARLFPLGKGQERVIAIPFALARWGFDLPGTLAENLTTDTTVHYVVDL